MRPHGSLWQSVTYALFPLRPVRIAQRILEPKLESDDLLSLDPRYSEWLNLEPDELKDLIEKERQRGNTLDEKLAKTTAVLALAFTIGGTLAKSFIDGVSTPLCKTAVWGGMTLSMLYMVVGGIYALFNALRPRPQSGIGPDFELQLQDEKDRGKRLRAEVLVELEILNTLRNNSITGALGSIRNGFICFSVAVLFALVIDPLLTLNQLFGSYFHEISSLCFWRHPPWC